MMSSNDFVKTHKVPEDTKCLCGDDECQELTAGFANLRDARQRFVKLPPSDEAHLDSPFYQERNRRRQAYLRHLNVPDHKETISDYIALHHFHPLIIQEYTRKIPKTLSLGKAVQLKMMLSEKDKVVDETTGMPYFMFVPNYAKINVKKDLETLIQETEVNDWTNTGDDDESEASTIEIPEHISFDEESDVSSIDCIFHHDKTDAVSPEPSEPGIVSLESSEPEAVPLEPSEPDIVPVEPSEPNVLPLQPSGPDIVPPSEPLEPVTSPFQALLRKFNAGNAKVAEIASDAIVVDNRKASKAVESLEETVDTTTDLEKEDGSKIADAAIVESDAVDDITKETAYYSFQQLKSGVEGVEYFRREQYLSPDEFQKVFDMSKEEFNGLRKWKQQELKKKVGLF